MLGMLRAMNLTDRQIKEARERYSKGDVSQQQLAQQLGASRAVIADLLAGRLRKEAGGPFYRPKRRMLTNKQVEQIRKAYAKGDVAQVEIAKQYGLDIASVSRMLRGLTYADAGGPLAETGASQPRPKKLTPEQMEEILESTGSHADLARRMGVSRQAVQQLRERWGWAARWATRLQHLKR
jgi:DNA-binding transcriptional regulator YiaG